MPESNHEVIIDGYVYPDTVTITLANDDFIGSRDYVSKDLYESVSSANDYWQADNEKLREENQHIGLIAYELGRTSLAQENAKLRDLVRRLYNMADFCRNCPDTERCDVDVEWLGCTVADPIDKLMDELGVEI